MAKLIPHPTTVVPDDEYALGGNPFDLSGRHALVTGAIGEPARALAVALAEAGARVSVTTSRDSSDEEAAADEILSACAANGRSGAVRRVSLIDEADVDGAVGSIEAEIAPIDILVNAAHEARIRGVLDSNAADWQTELDRNATSVFVACRSVGRRMVERGYGRIVTIVSIVHDRGVPNAALFAASQGAVLGFTRSLGVEWGRSGVTANALTIGFFDGVAGVQNDPDVRAILERYIPLRRLGTPEDLQGAIVYLCSEMAAFLDSEMVTVDGAIQVHA